MSIAKYKKQIIIIAVVLGILSFLLFSGISPESQSGSDQAQRFQVEALVFIPNNLFGVAWLVYLLLLIVVGALGGIFFGYLLGPLFLFLHKLIIGRKMEYGLIEKPSPTKFKQTFKAVFPALFAINFALILADNPVIQNIVTTDYLDQWPVSRKFFSFISLMPFMTGISMAVFSGVWFVLESGIIYSTKEKVKDDKRPMEVRSIGSWYIYFLKGYAGIGAIFLLYANLDNLLSSVMGSQESIYLMIVIICLLGPLPLIVSLLALPAVVFLDMLQNQREKYMIKLANKFGIIDNVEVTFKKIIIANKTA